MRSSVRQLKLKHGRAAYCRSQPILWAQRAEGILQKGHLLVFLSSCSGPSRSPSSSRKAAFSQMASANWNWEDWGELALAVLFAAWLWG